MEVASSLWPFPFHIDSERLQVVCRADVIYLHQNSTERDGKGGWESRKVNKRNFYPAARTGITDGASEDLKEGFLIPPPRIWPFKGDWAFLSVFPSAERRQTMKT